MGIEIHITVPHNLTELSLGSVEARFRSLAGAFGEISRFYAVHGVEYSTGMWAERVADDWEREWDRDFYGHVPVSFDAPAGFHFCFGPHAVSIHHYTRLGVFCTEPAIRQSLRSLTYQVVGLLAGDRAIYSPDDYMIYDMVMEGLTFAEIESRLLQSGLPATPFAEFDARQERPDHHYYIDRFEDFCETKAA